MLAFVLVSSCQRSQLLFSQSLPEHHRPSPQAVGLQIIVVDSEQQAGRILEQLRTGADFETLARQDSSDPTSSDGGYLGKVDPTSLRPELRDALTGLGEGQITGVIHISSGYAILKVVAKNFTRAPSSDPTQTPSLSATGVAKQLVDVSGLVESYAALQQFPKPDGWNLDPKQSCQLRKASLALAIDKLEKQLSADSTPDAVPRSAMDAIQLHYLLGQMYSYSGNMNAAAAQFETAYHIAESSLPAALPQIDEILGVLYLHKSEMENDVYLKPGIKCIFPFPPGFAYKKTASSERSIEYFLKYLDAKPDELDAKWLLNVAYMTLGKYPQAVPAKYLIPPSTFASKEDIGRFVDVAPQAGLNLFSMAGGLIVDDFENNGRFDVVTSSLGACDGMHYFHNNGDGTFTDRSARAGLSDQFGALNIIQTDYNNDGCLDILVLRGGWEFPQRKSLLRNNCDGTFTDVTIASKLGDVATATQTAVWADINNDGLLDLFVGNENEPSQLFLNKGDGTFEDIAKSAGVGRTAFTKGVVAADYDNDGYIDFYVSNLGTNFLYHNNHDNTFTEVAEKAGVSDKSQSFATWFFDYDNDGLPDLFVTSYYPTVDETVRSYMNLPHDSPTMKLFKNLGDGTFKDVTVEAGLDKVFLPMGANFGDIDNDGFLDIYLGTGNPSYASVVPNVLLRNHDGKYFVDITASSGTGELHKGHGVAFADMDNSGQVAILEEVGGAIPGDSHAMRLFQNPGNSNDWISIKLVGVKTNRPAIGARIKLTIQNGSGGRRSIYRWVGSGGSFGASPFEQHIGLGKSARISEVEIWWPSSKTRQIFTNVAKNQFISIKEFAQSYVKVDRKRYTLGGVSHVANEMAPANSSVSPNRD